MYIIFSNNNSATVKVKSITVKVNSLTVMVNRVAVKNSRITVMFKRFNVHIALSYDIQNKRSGNDTAK